MFGESLLDVATSFPTVVYTVLFGVSLTYWLMVAIGALDGGGGELEGGAKGILEGGAKGVMEGVAEGIDGMAQGALGAGKGAIEGISSSSSASVSGRRRGAKKTPITLLGSVGFTFSWMFSSLAMQALGVDTTLLWKLLVFVLAPLFGFALAWPLVRPLGRIFGVHHGERAADLRGSVAVVTTGRVGPTFGQATLERQGADLLIQVRAPEGAPITRGSRVLLLDFNEQIGAFDVEPMISLLGSAEATVSAQPTPASVHAPLADDELVHEEPNHGEKRSSS